MEKKSLYLLYEKINKNVEEDSLRAQTEEEEQVPSACAMQT